MKPLDDSALEIAPRPRPLAHPRGVAPARVAFHRPGNLLLPDRRRWAELATCAAAGNVFAADWFMEPALRHCGRERSLRLAVVEDAAGGWLGAMPLTLDPVIGRWPLPSRQSWHSANQFIGTPLVRPGAEKVFWEALLGHLDRHPGVALGLYADTLPLDDPATLALASLCAEHGRALHQCRSFTRPARLGASAGDPRAAKKLDKRLDGLERKLAEAHGEVRLVLHDHAEDCEPWLGAFLALERAGWKGRAASALGCHAATAGLFREVIREGHRRGAVRLASLTTGETIVAMTSWLVQRGRGYGFKMAFDERFRSFAPGRLLMRRVAGLAAAAGLTLFDTCTVPDAPDDPLWPDRRAFGDFAVAIGGPARRALFDKVMRAQTARRRGMKA
ncbi:GNAT family N-acetyltransferase [Porphyrobacter sp. CACIAM 03H1]|uniref:GNAT family N-acetyltransferase n=1 Tax=Porphyrobacter sp. CACIAM 03H1 TaxID=2003315 RepID=UPI0012FD3708|nr:GNAT family N-acetyltransferase [Porphyrobacter sp. CACIAM 03H1]